MRVESDRPSKNAMGGWLHTLDERNRKIHIAARPRNEAPRPTINASKLMLEYSAHTKPEWIDALAQELGVTPESLTSLECAWASEHRAWAFPMCDGYGWKVGIRLRAKDGSKWAVSGSRQGIFLPVSHEQRTAYICEGPTDTAAAMSIGLYAIGRPCCSGGVSEIQTCLSRMDIHRVVIIADNDKPGLGGASRLSASVNLPSCTLVLPCKDMREFVRMGGDACTLMAILKTMVWSMPNRSGELVSVEAPRRFT